MSMTTRESMRRELKELAKLAETMGKSSPDASSIEAASVEFPPSALERPVTPSASRVSVPPVAQTMTPVFDHAEPKKSAKRTGVIAVLVGAGLAIALVAGAAVGKSLAARSSASTPPVDVRGAAATLAPPPVVPTVAEPVAVAQPVAATAAVAPALAAPAKSASTNATPLAAAPVHKHVAAPRPVVAAPAASPKTANAANTSPVSAGSDAVATPKPAASPGLAKPAKVTAGGGGSDSLEDLIRKEVAAQKK